MKIAVAGTGYVGLSLAVLLSQQNEVVALDTIKENVDMISNNRQTKSIQRCRIYNNSYTGRL